MIRPGRIGFVAGMAACAATLSYDVVQVLQVVGVLAFPLDEILIYGTSLCIVAPFVLEIVALHHSRSGEARLWSQGAVVFATLYAAFASTNYVVQLATVVPAKLRGEVGPVSFLEQTPHSLMWDVDALAYLAMGLAALAAIPSLQKTGIEGKVRVAAMAHVGATALSGIVYFHPRFSTRLLVVGFPWAVTAPLFMLLLARALGGGATMEPDGSGRERIPAA